MFGSRRDPHDGGPPDAAALALAADSASVVVARRFVARTLDGRAPREVIADLVLATSELVTNAVEYGQPPPDVREPVRVSIDVDTDAATVSVSSVGGTLADPAAWRLPDPSARSGRGLGIVRAVVDQVSVKRYAEALVISARRAW